MTFFAISEIDHGVDFFHDAIWNRTSVVTVAVEDSPHQTDVSVPDVELITLAESDSNFTIFRVGNYDGKWMLGHTMPDVPDDEAVVLTPGVEILFAFSDVLFPVHCYLYKKKKTHVKDSIPPT